MLVFWLAYFAIAVCFIVPISVAFIKGIGSVPYDEVDYMFGSILGIFLAMFWPLALFALFVMHRVKIRLESVRPDHERLP